MVSSRRAPRSLGRRTIIPNSGFSPSWDFFFTSFSPAKTEAPLRKTCTDTAQSINQGLVYIIQGLVYVIQSLVYINQTLVDRLRNEKSTFCASPSTLSAPYSTLCVPVVKSWRKKGRCNEPPAAVCTSAFLGEMRGESTRFTGILLPSLEKIALSLAHFENILQF